MKPTIHISVCRLASCLPCMVLAGFAWSMSAVGSVAIVCGESQPAELAEFLEQNCTSCHDALSQEGDLDLDAHSFSLVDPDDFHIWERVFDRVREDEMPPNESLAAGEKSRFLETLHKHLQGTDAARIAKRGRVSARRLTRAQYERNVNDLLAIDVPLQEHLPVDSLTNGFETVSKSQQISSHHMAAYLQAADTALEAAFTQVMTDEPTHKVRLDWNQLRRNERKTNREPEGRPAHEDVVSWSTRQNFYGRMPATAVPVTGRYRIRVRVQAVNPPESGTIWCSFRSGVCAATATTYYWIGSLEATTEPTEHEFEAWIREGHQLQLRPNDRALRLASAGSGKGEINGPAGYVEEAGYPGVSIQWMEMERIDDASRQDTRRALIGSLPLQPVEGSSIKLRIVSGDPLRDLQELVHSFAERAFRRPAKRKELRPYVELAKQRLQEDGQLHEALRAAYRAVLCSSRFLYFEELPGLLDNHALATRLSHFLWGRSPDRELSRVANTGQLGDERVLHEQTSRLLADARSASFVEEFTDQWLKLYDLNSTTPDGKLYPEYDDVLHHSLVQETHAFVRELLDQDLPVTNIVDSNFTFVNSRLARHYRIEWPGGTGLQKVRLSPEDRRGGVITHASVLKVTANGTTTSPVVRGMWMLERIMGQHVPPPPANVPAVEPDIRGATSIRDQLNKHRELDSCAACHARIDPPGFALESYDVIGGWRERYRAVAGEGKKKWVEGLPVDPSHTLHGGGHFEDIQGLKRKLVERPEQLARNLASHFVTYATGAAPTFADREALDAIVGSAELSDYGVRSLLHEVVQSRLFRNK